MATNTYSIPERFPNGLCLNLLIRQMLGIWPEDLRLAEYSIRGRPNRTVSVGFIQIDTPRALTGPEVADALNQFAIHDPTEKALPGFTIDELPSPEHASQTLYVRDLARAFGPELGTMAYSNGTEWRRTSDDAIVA